MSSLQEEANIVGSSSDTGWSLFEVALLLQASSERAPPYLASPAQENLARPLVAQSPFSPPAWKALGHHDLRWAAAQAGILVYWISLALSVEEKFVGMRVIYFQRGQLLGVAESAEGRQGRVAGLASSMRLLGEERWDADIDPGVDIRVQESATLAFVSSGVRQSVNLRWMVFGGTSLRPACHVSSRMPFCPL